MLIEAGRNLPPEDIYKNSQGISKVSPLSVINGTGLSLDVYLFSGQNNTQGVSEFLHDYTLPLLHKASNAVSFLSHFGLEYNDFDYQTIRQEIGNTGSPIELQEDLEALDLAHVIFSYLPEKYEIPLLPTGFSRRGMLNPPQTVHQHGKRVREVTNMVDGIQSGKIKPLKKVGLHIPLLRTHAFFTVGSALPEYSEKIQSTSEIIYESVNRLIESCDFEKPV